MSFGGSLLVYDQRIKAHEERCEVSSFNRSCSTYNKHLISLHVVAWTCRLQAPWLYSSPMMFDDRSKSLGNLEQHQNIMAYFMVHYQHPAPPPKKINLFVIFRVILLTGSQTDSGSYVTFLEVTRLGGHINLRLCSQCRSKLRV